jgi:hypothetical protein
VLNDDGTIRLRPAKIAVAGTPDAERSVERAEADLEAGRKAQFDSVEEYTEDTLINHRNLLSELEEDDAQVSMGVIVQPIFTSVNIQRGGESIFERRIQLGSLDESVRQLLVNELAKTVELFQSAGGSRIGKVFLYTDPSRMPGLANELESRAKISVQEIALDPAAAPRSSDETTTPRKSTSANAVHSPYRSRASR